MCRLGRRESDQVVVELVEHGLDLAAGKHVGDGRGHAATQ
jgi:hypothetical protein